MTSYQVNTLRAQGFDATTSRRVACSACEVIVINGVACHEHGCQHQKSECHRCNAIVERGVRYCEDCR